MIQRKWLRRLAWTAASISALLLVVWLLRWPLFGGLIRGELRSAVAEFLKAEVESVEFSGNLVSSLRVERVVLQPQSGAAFRELSVRRIDVGYGFLGSGDLEIDVDGLRVVLAEGPPPTPDDPPLHRTLQGAIPAGRSFRFPGTVRVGDSEVILADGRSLAVDELTLDPSGAKVAGRTKGFGEVRVVVAFGEGEALTIEATAEEGPVPSARIQLGPMKDRTQPLHVEARFQGRPLTWAGKLIHDDAGLLQRAEGKLEAPEGRVTASVDFVSGDVDLDVDVTVALQREIKLEEELRADVHVKAHLKGPLAGPRDAWSLTELEADSKDPWYEGFTLDEVKVTSTRGTLSEVHLRAVMRRGEDQATAHGILRWKEALEIDSIIRVTAEAAKPYLDLFNPDLPLRVTNLSAEGKQLYGPSGVSFDGRMKSGPGGYGDETWGSVEVDGRFSPESIDVRELVVTGSRFAPQVRVSGKLDLPEGKPMRIRSEVKAGKDTVEVEGEILRSGDFNGTFRVEGPLESLKAMGVELPESLRPTRVSGRVAKSGDTYRFELDVAAGDDLALSPQGTARKDADGWTIDLEPGTITVRGGEEVRHGAIRLRIEPDRAALSDVRLVFSNPELAGSLAATAEWNEKEARVVLDMRGFEGWGIGPESLFIRGAFHRESGALTAEARWGEEGADHLLVDGRLGEKNDLRVKLRIPDLGRSPYAKLLADLDPAGGVSLDARLTGTFEKPVVDGALGLHAITAAGAPPLTLTVPMRTDNGVLIVLAEEETPYGALKVNGRVPLDGEAMTVSVRLETTDFDPILTMLPKESRPLVPRGTLSLRGEIDGKPGDPKWRVAAEFESALYRPPAPLGEVTDLRLVAKADADGVRLETLEGRLGQGPFRARGHWNLWDEGRPIDVVFDGEDLLAVDERLAHVRVDAKEVRFSGSQKDGFLLAGKIGIPLALFHPEFGGGGGEGGKPKTAELRGPAVRLLPAKGGGSRVPGLTGPEKLALDLEVETTGELRLENSMVAMLVEGKGAVRGTAAEPSMSGSVRVTRGEVRLVTGIFIRIVSAEVDLPSEEGKEPTVHFEGKIGKGEGEITAVLDGLLSGPRVFLSSDPPRPQEELLALLAFGTGPGETTGGQILGNLAMKMFQEYRGVWPSVDRDESLLGQFAERFNVGITTEEEANRQRVPWQLPSSGTARGTVVRTEYIWSRHFSIVAETDSQANLSGDLKLRLLFR